MIEPKRLHRAMEMQPVRLKPFTDQELEEMSAKFGAGFGDWYKQNYDEHGLPKPFTRVPGARSDVLMQH